MIAQFGSGEAWQRAKTIEWMAKIGAMNTPKRGILFEGQTRLSFLVEAAAEAGGIAYVPILVDCHDDTRIRRLSIDRKQPELASADMMNWASYLRREASMSGCEILNTSDVSLDECIAFVCARLKLNTGESQQ